MFFYVHLLRLLPLLLTLLEPAFPLALLLTDLARYFLLLYLLYLLSSIPCFLLI